MRKSGLTMKVFTNFYQTMYHQNSKSGSFQNPEIYREVISKPATSETNGLEFQLVKLDLTILIDVRSTYVAFP
jgi:hypothetical protein